MLNLEPVKEMLKSFQHILVRGISDSGWFLDRPPYSKDVDSLAPVDAVKRGHILWEGQVPASCKSHYPQEPWRCYFGYRLYSTLKGRSINHISVTNRFVFSVQTFKYLNLIFSSFIHIPMVVWWSSNDSRQCWYTCNKTTMGLYS